MSRPHFFDQPSVPRLFQVIQDVRSGRMLIPDFQRPFEWDDERRLLLLDSVNKGIPIGSFLVWKTRVPVDGERNSSSGTLLQTYRNLGPFRLPLPEPGSTANYLIDGHQRLTTLFAALNWTDQEDLLLDEGFDWPIYFDLRAEPGSRGFVTRPPSGRVPPTFLPLSIIFTPKLLFEFQKDLYRSGYDQEADRAESLANDFKDYQIPVVPLVTDNLDLVTDAFVRINSQGKRMRETYMLQALSYARFPIRDRSERLRAALAPEGWSGLDEQILVNALKVRWGLDVYQSGPRELVERFERAELEHPGPAVSHMFDELERDMRSAIGLLRVAGVFGPAVLPYAYQLVAFAEAARRNGGIIPNHAVNDLVSWFWVTTYTAYFTGMTGTRIRAAIEHVCDIADGRSRVLPHEPRTEIAEIQRYNFAAVRSKAWLIRLAMEIKTPSRREESLTALGAGGASVVERLDPAMTSDAPGARVVLPASTLGLLRRYASSTKSDIDLELLEDVVISPHAFTAWRNGDLTTCVALRGDEIRMRERRFVKTLGLTTM